MRPWSDSASPDSLAPHVRRTRLTMTPSSPASAMRDITTPWIGISASNAASSIPLLYILADRGSPRLSATKGPVNAAVLLLRILLGGLLLAAGALKAGDPSSLAASIAAFRLLPAAIGVACRDH